ncbi:hypothetical protein EJ05DRAFT_395684 [Pseudovirgaria hyperparasitica]|uniref:Uncharacterized protein n=1 Tax=Pseudovirgaria hyperparasitica TaxID=470096 RepID=A0A6A6W3W4_9PEZI|nr:uncharacterized protein EJ05DRAFT_395684 [Pseudovirgaria hyperparasitica]KAF2757628.1 hypothetical protein EJ05DRAFT_395684 [Pseudovirgaria hyperparasitica]
MLFWASRITQHTHQPLPPSYFLLASGPTALAMDGHQKKHPPLRSTESNKATVAAVAAQPVVERRGDKSHHKVPQSSRRNATTAANESGAHRWMFGGVKGGDVYDLGRIRIINYGTQTRSSKYQSSREERYPRHGLYRGQGIGLTPPLPWFPGPPPLVCSGLTRL